MSVDFYRAFEDKFRGARELILSRLNVYLPFVHPIKEVSVQPSALDLGCGRGEWLELLDREGFDATGVDLDEGMLKACEQLHLTAHKADALSYLESLPDASVGVVSAFHMVEHIPFDALQQLVQQALRVLIPGGLLIMETPNPENLQVGAHTFYYDPTHGRPIPPMLLAFLPEHYGFARTKILRLQQDPRLETALAPDLMDVLCGPSPDYAVVAQKQAKAHNLAKFDQAFATDHGLTLQTLATRYDNSRAQQVEASQSIAQQALSSAVSASTVAQQALSSADSASTVAQQAFADARLTRELIANFEATLQHHQQLTAISEQRINELLNSTSWRITTPLRWLSAALRKLLALPWRVARYGVRALLLPVMRFVLARPSLRQSLRSSLERFPAVAHRLHLLAIHRGLVPLPPEPSPPDHSLPPSEIVESAPLPPDPPLSPHAGRIYARLQRAATSQALKPIKHP